MTRIALVPLSYDAKKYEAFNITTFLLAKELKSLGNEVYIITRRNPGQKKEETVDGVRVFRPVYSPRFSNIFDFLLFPVTQLFVQAYAVYKANKKYNLKLEVVNSISSAPIVALRSFIVKRLIKNIKTVHTLKGISMLPFGSMKYSRFLNFSDKVVVQTEFLKKKVIENGCRKEKVKVIDTLIDLSKFKPAKKDFRKKYGFGKEKIVMYYGHLKPIKGVDYLIRASQFFGKNVKFVIVWSGAGDFQYHMNLINVLGVSEKFKIIPSQPVENLVELISCADVLVFPYSSVKSTEMPPSSVLESLACRKPVVTSDFPELKVVFTDKKDVLYSKPRDAKDLSEKINLVLSDKKQAEKLMKNSVSKAKQFDAKQVAKKYSELYKYL